MPLKKVRLEGYKEKRRNKFLQLMGKHMDLYHKLSSTERM